MTGIILGSGTSLLGAYQGLTYYSQADSRWASIVYTSTGNSSQTIKSSGCGPTSAAMVVSSSKGAILPTTMAQLSVDNGYRTVSNGTAWAYFSFVADYFDFNEFHTTYNYDTMLSYLTQKNEDGTSKYYVIVSCGSGLFTSGGHYIVLVSDTDETITVYDSYLYSGKFDTASRRNAGAVVSGNSVYVTEEAFEEYANYRCFWIFSNDEGEGNTSNIELFNAEVNCSEQSVNYTRYVSTKASNLNVRSGAGMSHSVLTTIPKGTAVTVTGVSGNWSYITSPVSGWVSTAYLSSTAVTTYTENYVTTINAYYRLKSRTKLYASSSMSGTSYNYLAKTQIKVISHVSSTIDYIYVPATGRYSYCYVSAYTSSTTSSTSTSSVSANKTYSLSQATKMYTSSAMTTGYNYKKYTKVTVLSVSGSTAKVKVNVTGLIRYVNTKYLK